jgi:hypothetical protein
MIGECEGFSRVWQVASLGWRFQQVRHVGNVRFSRVGVKHEREKPGEDLPAGQS